eukprot:Gb_24997 [translate_table: standard]
MRVGSRFQRNEAPEWVGKKAALIIEALNSKNPFEMLADLGLPIASSIEEMVQEKTRISNVERMVEEATIITENRSVLCMEGPLFSNEVGGSMEVSPSQEVQVMEALVPAMALVGCGQKEGGSPKRDFPQSKADRTKLSEGLASEVSNDGSEGTPTLISKEVSAYFSIAKD